MVYWEALVMQENITSFTFSMVFTEHSLHRRRWLSSITIKCRRFDSHSSSKFLLSWTARPRWGSRPWAVKYVCAIILLNPRKSTSFLIFRNKSQQFWRVTSTPQEKNGYLCSDVDSVLVNILIHPVCTSHHHIILWYHEWLGHSNVLFLRTEPSFHVFERHCRTAVCSNYYNAVVFPF